MSRCECCQEESVVLVPVMNYDATNPYEHELVCPTCADFISSVHPALYHMQLFTLRQKKLTSASFGAVFSFDVELAV